MIPMGERLAVVFILLPFVLIQMLVVAIVWGTIAPAFLIGSGVRAYDGEDKELARAALYRASPYMAGEPYALMITATQVSSVKKCTETPQGHRDAYSKSSNLNKVEPPPFSAEIDLYTIFGIPYGQVKMYCDGGGEVIRSGI